MKNNIKKIFAIALAIIAIFSLAVSVLAADISAERAKEIALNNAGFSADEVIYIKADYDIDDGMKIWNVDFLVKDSDNRVRDYDYELSASNGKILEKDWEFEDDLYPDKDDKIEDAVESFFRRFINWLVSLFSKQN